MTQKPMVVIGSGLAGYMFAKEWRKLNTKQPLVIISRDDAHFYSKPLLSNALAKNKSPAELVTTPVAAMREQLNARILDHTIVIDIDAQAKTVFTESERIEYDQLILATGAKPITPPLRGDIDALWQVNHLSDYTPFREKIDSSQSIIIIGSGLIGCEFANDLLSSGHQIQVVSLEQTPLDRLTPSEIGKALQEKLSDAGVQFHMGEKAISIKKTGDGVSLELDSGKTLTADCVLCAIGIQPDLSLAEKAGVETKRGIVVNEFLQTSDPNIFALGDTAELNGRVELYIAPLLLCARTLAKNLANPDAQTPVTYRVMPVTVKTPIYPIVVAPPLVGTNGEWSCETVDDSLVARFKDSAGSLKGFALGHATGKLRMQLAKEMGA